VNLLVVLIIQKPTNTAQKWFVPFFFKIIELQYDKTDILGIEQEY
jgi:hypothetical protein